MSSEYHPRPFHIFLSFAYEDRTFRDELDKHLTAFQRIGLIDDWHTLEVSPGSNWQDVVDEQLNQADIILLFITPDFIASNYCYSVQMKQALKKHDAGQVCVIPIRFRPTYWYDLPFAKLQGLPVSGDKAVSEWKNRDKAYVEITEGIKKAIDDLTTKFTNQTNAPPPVSSHSWNIPYARNQFFTGRDELIHSLHEMFLADRENTLSIQAISGFGGIGKTQVALEYAYRYSNDYHALFWLKGDSAEDLLADFMHLATLLNLPERNEADQHIVIAAIKRSLSHAPRWLLIIDHLETFELLDELIPTRGLGNILITTQRQATGTLATLREIEKMTLDEGALFLLRRAKAIAPQTPLDTLPASSMKHARAICQHVDGHPLALDQAGAYLEETKISLPRYITLYQKHAAALLKQRGKFATGHADSITTTLTLCLAKVKTQNPTCLEILSLCAFLHPDAIPIAFFSTGAPDFGVPLQALVSDELAFNKALELLLDFSLLRRNSDTEAISMHRLVQVILRDEMEINTQQLWIERAVKILCRLFPESELGVWQQCQYYLPHALVAADFIKQWSLSFSEAARLLYLAGSYLYDIASYIDARRLCEQALTINEQLHGDEHPETARTLHCLGNIYESTGDTTQAQQHYERALGLAERVWGPEHPDTARLLNDLGEHFQESGQFPLAEDYYRRALAIRQKIFGLEHPDTASSLNNIAGICEEQNRYEQAEMLYEQALLLRERLRGPHHPDTAESLSNVARFYRVVGKYPLAGPLYERAIVAYEHAFGPVHPRVGTCYNNFAVFCIALGQYTQAEQLLTQAIEIRTQLFGLHHPSTAGSWNHLARVYYKQGLYKQAQTLYEQALTICEQVLGRQHPNTTAILINMGELYLAQGNDHRAEEILTEALANITAGQEPESPAAATVLNLLGEVYLVRAQYERAEHVLTQALTIRQKVLGKAHPETAMSLKSLGDLALATNKDAQAEVLYQQALEIVLGPLGISHPDVIILVEHLVTLLQKMGRAEDAHILVERVHSQPSP